ncbi:hypothetical protein GAO09_04110 [Rhizobiales bacterium RZME27]|uniref:Uncharacterized protein n=1 Tax=Endobacterium cereale TaxID=2663029 RepID=A0A6A8A6J7_9HYPH|nr:hypothetical protein [Endobacterium cereale]MEB2845988.1 hypothetical protein [Endobacterium cereale]MQY45250.1 hypothetical protein [Endobacterium cereale]
MRVSKFPERTVILASKTYQEGSFDGFDHEKNIAAFDLEMGAFVIFVASG